MSKKISNLFKHSRADLLSSIVVFLVALPLCLGIALASGVPLLSGLISGIVGGIIIGIASKSHLSVSGPAAGLVVIVINAIATLGSFETFLFAVFLAGLIQLILGFAKAGVIGMYFPSSVIKGMLAAIGLILIMKQIPYLIGIDSNAFSDMTLSGSNAFSSYFEPLTNPILGSLIIGILSLTVLIIWGSKRMQKIKIIKQIPGGIVVVVFGVLLNLFFQEVIPGIAITSEHLVQIPIFSDFSSFSGAVIFPSFEAIGNPQTYIIAITIAIVASLETLLCSEAIDRMDPRKRTTPSNAELKAQGIGNMVCGFIGGLPVTAVIVRSSTNLAAGGRTKMAAIYHGIFLLIAVALLPVVMNKIPLASLAAILIMVGYKLTKPVLYKEQFKVGLQQFIPFIVTIAAILMTDLLIGILVGLAVGVFYILKANYQVPYKYSEEKNGSDKLERIVIQLSEHVSFLNKANLRNTLEHLPDYARVVIDGSNAKRIDHDALEVIHNFKFRASEKNINAEFVNIPSL